MADIDVKKLQNIELEILKEFVRLCDKHNLTYSLAFGTAIGAIRHKGFIPWDDDIDIIMPRKDYEYFWRVAAKEMNENYFFQNYHTEKNCGYIFGKIRKNNTVLSEHYSYHVKMHQGVWIDVFPIDNVSDSREQFLKDIKKIALYKNLYTIKCGYNLPQDKNTLINKIAYTIAKIGLLVFSRDFFIKKLENEIQKYNNIETNNVYLCGGTDEKNKIPATWLSEMIKVPFEDTYALIVKEYDRWLTHHYGDYMQLPPVEKRANGSCHFVKEFKEKVEE